MLVWSYSHCIGLIYSSHQANGTIVGYPKATATTDNLFTAQCDILIPAAGEKQITAKIAGDIKAKVSCSSTITISALNEFIKNYTLYQIIAEGANGPTTIGAERILHKNNVLVIPVSV